MSETLIRLKAGILYDGAVASEFQFMILRFDLTNRPEVFSRLNSGRLLFL